MVIVGSARPIVGGVDTHRDVNVAAVIDSNGGLLGVESFPTTPAGHRDVHAWMNGFGELNGSGSKAPARMAPASPATSCRRE